jgi:hypothetical protein
MYKSIAVLILLLMPVTRTFGQIIYEPVRYQYGSQTKFYYGGSDPAILAFGCAQTDSRILTVYSDARTYENVAIYGCTVSDARNEAYANVPQYSRKRDLIAAGNLAPDGTVVVGAQAQPVESAPGPAAVPADDGMLRPIIIIPRGQAIPPAPKSHNITITMN